jgi:TonB family protein
MLGVLFESRARTPRRTGETVLSVAAHMAVIGGAVIAPAHRKNVPPERTPAVIVHFAPPQPLSAAPRRVVTSSASGSETTVAPLPIPVIAVPGVTPVSLPVIEASHAAPIEQAFFGSAASGTPGRARDLDVGAGAGADTELRGTELVMRIVASAKPIYPSALRQAGIGGHVIIRFTVDTAGRVDMGSVQVIESTHPLFAAAVRMVLPSYRFKPSEAGGRRIASTAEMPFEFTIAR